MFAWFSERSLSDFTSWMRVQAQEELFHATKIYDYILERGGRVKFVAIAQPETEWKAGLGVSKDVVKHEERVTGTINDLVDVAAVEKDHAAIFFHNGLLLSRLKKNPMLVRSLSV